MLKLRLEGETQRRRQLEQAASTHRAIDVPMHRRAAAPHGLAPRPFSKLLDSIGRTQPPPMRRAAEVLDQAAQRVDEGALLLGRQLRGSSAARIGLCLYAVLVHLWLFVLLTHSLPMPLSMQRGKHGKSIRA